MALIEQLGDDGWQLVCTACCHMAQIFAIMHLSLCRPVRSITSVPKLPRLRASFSGIFLQPLPELVTPLKGRSLSPRSCPENCQLTSSFSVLCPDNSKFVTKNSNKTRRVNYSREQSLHQHK